MQTRRERRNLLPGTKLNIQQWLLLGPRLKYFNILVRTALTNISIYTEKHYYYNLYKSEQMWEIAEIFWQFNKKIFDLTSLGTKCYYISNTIYWRVLTADASIVMQYSAIKYLKIFYICFAPDFWTSDTLKPVQLLTGDWLHRSISTRLG